MKNVYIYFGSLGKIEYKIEVSVPKHSTVMTTGVTGYGIKNGNNGK